MSFESKLKKDLEIIGEGATFQVCDIRSSTFKCASPLIKAHKGDTYCQHRLILVSTANEGFLTGLETYEYALSSKESTDKRVIYISKVDTTSSWKKYQGLTARVVQSYIASLPRSSSVFVFARAQPQYLFAKSAENKSKSVLNDRQLVSWWLSVFNKLSVQCEGWWSVPGIDDSNSALIEIGAKKRGWEPSEKVKWTYGTSYAPDAIAEQVIPRFDDDAKSRLLKSTQEQDMTVQDFWSILSFGEECGSGKITGFFELRLVDGSLSEDMDTPLTVKNRDFTVFWNKFMSLDFHSDEANVESAKSTVQSIKDMFPDLQPIEIQSKAATGTNILANNTSADKRPAVNMLSAGFIKRKKV
ncbi:H3 K56 histone acetylation protein RTT109 [Mucor circinelloides 1006PhL]|uniref:histone acetyltransferase n=1 Tax=Mucor circinelloides f. circinelloides (strain 1006PhL) TaxID=1220926 RepID=S2K0V2_MUCC1|nr:H3 K56 histone acetylation protein RTT109 [Mucor circinelloides 1006PhL]